MTTDKGLLPVEQADRDMAADWMVDGEGLIEAYRDRIKSGSWDEAGIVQLLARHRLATRTPSKETEGAEDVWHTTIARAYIQGASDVHRYWTDNPGEAPRGDPEFGEAASDYASAALDPFDSSAFGPASPPAPAEAIREEVEMLREALAAKPWPPSDNELRLMLADIVGAWWSVSTGHVLRDPNHRPNAQDIKGMYAVRDALAPYVARAALRQPTPRGDGEATHA